VKLKNQKRKRKQLKNQHNLKSDYEN